VLLEPPLGTVVGSFAGWFLAFWTRTASVPIILSAAFLGTAVAAVRLKRISQRAPVSDREAAI
jgi:hypothetical protein